MRSAEPLENPMTWVAPGELMPDRTLKLAKITMPMVADAVDRPRLTEMIDGTAAKPILWISGPAGCGKTTLASSYVRARRPTCLWYQVGPGDGDPASFFHFLRQASQAAQAASPRSRKPLPPALAPEFAVGLPAFARRFFRDLFGRLKSPFLVVFDNVQDGPEGPPFWELLREGLGQIPPGGRVVLASRSAPPPALARFRAGRQLAAIGWTDLRLTRTESDALVEHWGRRHAEPVAASRVFEATDGWIAGVVLLAAATGVPTVSAGTRSEPPDEGLFDYFATEVFRKADPDRQRFLLRSAFLPEMTPATAAEITGDGNAARILAKLARDGFFTDRRSGAEPVYQYHPLFRAFLVRQAEETLDAGSLADLRRGGAEILERAGHLDGAADLLAAGEAWGELARLVCVSAPGMAAHGRMGAIGEWLARLPADVKEGVAALVFWEGASRLFADPAAGRARLETAFEMAKADGDSALQWISWSAIVESFMLELRDISNLDHWLSEFRELQRRGVDFPSRDVEVRALNAFLWIFGIFPGLYEDLNAAATRLLTLAQESFDPVSQGRRSFMQVAYHSWYGEMNKAVFLLETLCPSNKADCPPEVWLQWKVFECCFAWLAGSYDRCQRAFDEGMEVIREFGAESVATYLTIYGLVHALSVNDMVRARELLDSLTSPLSGLGADAEWQGSDVRRWYYHMLSALYEILCGNAVVARQHAELSLACNVHDGSIMEMGGLLATADAALAQGDLGTVERCLAQVAAADGSRRLVPIRMSCLYTEADLARRTGDGARCRRALGEALGLSRETGVKNPPFWQPARMAELCVIALEAGIEVPFVQEMVRERNLRPASPPRHLENWPWPLRIYTLGDFGVVRDGERLAFSGKAKRRPLDLLKALIAFGGRGVAVDRLKDALWPDADGDMAQQSFDTTLYRLRRLLAVDGALVLAEGRLTLSAHVCWVDVWALRDILAKAGEALKTPSVDPVDIERWQETVLALYRGGFLEHLSDAPWALSAATTLSLALVRFLHDAGCWWEARDRPETAAECFRLGLDIGAPSETLGRSLRAGLRRVTDTGEAVAE